jgi:FAD/FMN-containing dehydrogenase
LLETRHIDELRRAVSGVIAPADSGYDDARRLWNSIHDRRPAVIVRPRRAEEVGTAIAFAREHDLEISVRSGGHSALGFGGVDGGLSLDMSAMRGVVVDPVARTARVNGGALLGELDVAAQAHGLVCPTGVVGHTGVAGLTLGGGVGRLQRNFGLTIDNLTAVELVTADGRFVRASEGNEPELFWGLRGAGWNFGIATAFEFRLHPFGPDLHRGVLTFPASDIHRVWDAFRTYARNAPDAVSVILGMERGPAGVGLYLAYNHSGAKQDVERDTAGLVNGLTPLTTSIDSQPYLEVQGAHDLMFAWGSRSFIKGHYADDVRPDALDALVEHVADSPDGASFSITALGGAIGRVPEDATAYSGRATAFDLSADSSWADPALDDANIGWCRRAVEVVEADRGLGAYANGNSDASPAQTLRIFGAAKLARLVALKRAWDPENIFHVNPNVAP